MNKPGSPVYKGQHMHETTFDEAAVVADAQRGDQVAFGALVEAYQRRAYFIAYGIMRNREDALEAAQEAFARAYNAMDRFDTSMPFYPWLYRIVKNTCLNKLKRKRRRKETSLDSLMEVGYDPSDGVMGPERTVEMRELRAAILSAMDDLSEDHREILLLRHFQDLSYAEIAQCLDIPQGTVMSRLHAARKKLQEKLSGVL